MDIIQQTLAKHRPSFYSTSFQSMPLNASNDMTVLEIDHTWHPGNVRQHQDAFTLMPQSLDEAVALAICNHAVEQAAMLPRVSVNNPASTSALDHAVQLTRIGVGNMLGLTYEELKQIQCTTYSAQQDGIYPILKHPNIPSAPVSHTLPCEIKSHNGYKTILVSLGTHLTSENVVLYIEETESLDAHIRVRGRLFMHNNAWATIYAVFNQSC